MHIYLIPGLGLDGRIFKHLDLKGHAVTILNWLEPYKNESLRDYAQRMANDIDNKDQNVLIGHSFGGILSQEIASFKSIQKVILISSIKSRDEHPLQWRIFKPLGLYRLMSKPLMIDTVGLWGAMHDYVSKEEKQLFRHMANAHSHHYLRWAMKRLSEWNKPDFPTSTEVIHFHGTNDKTFPYKLIQNPDYTIEEGGHFMVYRRASELNEILSSHI